MEFNRDNVKLFLGTLKPAFNGQMSLIWPGDLLTACLIKEMAECLSQGRCSVIYVLFTPPFPHKHLSSKCAVYELTVECFCSGDLGSVNSMVYSMRKEVTLNYFL